MSSQHDWPKQKYTILYALRQGWPWLLASLLVLAWLSLSFAWVQLDSFTEQGFGKQHWRQKQATFTFGLGCENTEPIEQWGPCWDDVAQHALAEWNDAGSQFRFRTARTARTPPPSCNQPDRTNVVVWGETVCGQGIGADILAIAWNWTWENGEIADSDIVFNTRYEWAAYPGPWLSDRPDLHRVAIHEGGHALGLDHPDDHGQRVAAIMNAYADDTETLQADDIDGVQAIYGRDPAYVAPVKGYLENPGHRSFRSGIGVISGWVCDAETVEVQIRGDRWPMAYGTPRPDTEGVCGDINNGFVSLVNFTNWWAGTHTARLVVDGKPHGDPIEFKVTDFGTTFLRGASGQYEIEFPNPGDTTVLIWDQNSQNFQVKERR